MALTRFRKTITLPSTAQDEVPETIEIRRITALELAERGIPDPVLRMSQEANKAKAAIPAPDAETEKAIEPEAVQYNINICLAAVTKHPAAGRLVNKKPEDCTDDEFSWFDLDGKDQSFIISEVFGLMNGGAASAAAFPPPAA
jgi:hypothetical protein